MAAPFPRLYAILDVDLTRTRGFDPIQVFHAWLDAGVQLIQLRAKTMAGGPMLDLATRLAADARRGGAVFVVNDRADVARLSGADGVHVGQDDLSPADVRLLLPAPAVVGLSTHNERQLQAAATEPVSYVAIGPVFGTSSKEKPDPVVGVEGVRRAVELSPGRPVVAIGGITIERAPEIIGAGASSVAVISDLLAPDVRVRARQFLDAVG